MTPSGMWKRVAAKTVHEVLRALPSTATDAELDEALSNAYPFGERKYYPYKAWLGVVKEWKAAWHKGYRPKK